MGGGAVIGAYLTEDGGGGGAVIGAYLTEDCRGQLLVFYFLYFCAVVNGVTRLVSLCSSSFINLFVFIFYFTS